MEKPSGISPKFEQLINNNWNNPKRIFALLIMDNAAVLLTVVALAARALALACEADWMRLISEALVLGISFVVVSVFRKIINMPRPYELGNIERIDKEKSKKGESFPSRHVFSAFVIATVIAAWNVWIAAALYVIGSLMAVIRVVMGKHFIKDVVAGAIIGVAAGVIGLLIIH